MTNRSRVDDPPILAQKQQKMAIFEKKITTDYWGLKDPLEVQHETCSTICRTPVPAILNPNNLTGMAGGAKNSQNWVFLKVPNIATFGCFWPLLPTRSNFYGPKWLVQMSRI